MKKIAVLMIAIGALVSGCAVYETPYQDRGQHRGEREHEREHEHERDRDNRMDRDGDGVRNSQDRRPDDPRRY